jgi:hypothetical protein
MPDSIRLSAKVERKAEYPQLPRFIVVPASAIAEWKLTRTTTVEGTLNRVDLGRRGLKQWDAERWFFELPDPVCRRARVDVGDTVQLELRLASEELPAELQELIGSSDQARQAWQALSPGNQRVLREHILKARQSATRMNRARKALLPAESKK